MWPRAAQEAGVAAEAEDAAAAAEAEVVDMRIERMAEVTEEEDGEEADMEVGEAVTGEEDGTMAAVDMVEVSKIVLLTSLICIYKCGENLLKEMVSRNWEGLQMVSLVK
jgi:hypothetical protein